MLVGVGLCCPTRLMELKATHDVICHIEASLVKNALPCCLIHLRSKELKLGSYLFSSITGVLHFESRAHWSEVSLEAEVPSE